MARSIERAAPRSTARRPKCWRAPATELPDIPPSRNALDALAAIGAAAAPRVEALHIDLADLRGYHYQPA